MPVAAANESVVWIFTRIASTEIFFSPLPCWRKAEFHSIGPLAPQSVIMKKNESDLAGWIEAKVEKNTNLRT